MKKNSEIKKEVRKAEPIKTGDLEKAIERIHQEYNNDLQAFFRDATNIALKQNARLKKSEATAA